MKQLLERLAVCWAVLRGHSVIRRVTITGGTVDLTEARRVVISDATLRNGLMLTSGPAHFVVGRDCTWMNNTGTALDYPGGVEYR